MNFPYFISKRIIKSGEGSFASTISKVAVVSISLGLSAMILAFFILGGFQETIKNKIFDLNGHLAVTKYNLGGQFDEMPISRTSLINGTYDALPFIDHMQTFAHKTGMLRTEEEVHGVVYKGLGTDVDTLRFNHNLIAGRFPNLWDSLYSKEVVISKTIARKLKLKLNDEITILFVQNPPRFRKLTIIGIYETGMENFDDRLVYGDLKLIQRLNKWDEQQVAGFEIFVKPEFEVDLCRQELFNLLDADLFVASTEHKYLNIFDWLGLLNQNVGVFLGLILVVACFNMISILLILIMERTYMIGVLQSLGANRKQVRRVFMYNGMLLILRGLLFGNLVALIIAFVQDKYHLIPLDPANYYMYYVPISWNFEVMLYLNVLTFIVVSASLFLPLTVISRIRPVAALRFD